MHGLLFVYVCKVAACVEKADVPLGEMKTIQVGLSQVRLLEPSVLPSWVSFPFSVH
jgi:hypothetical protein